MTSLTSTRSYRLGHPGGASHSFFWHSALSPQSLSLSLLFFAAAGTSATRFGPALSRLCSSPQSPLQLPSTASGRGRQSRSSARGAFASSPLHASSLLSVSGCAARHEARHSPRLRLAPACSHPRSRPGVAELGVVRRLTRYAQTQHRFLFIRCCRACAPFRMLRKRRGSSHKPSNGATHRWRSRGERSTCNVV